VSADLVHRDAGKTSVGSEIRRKTSVLLRGLDGNQVLLGGEFAFEGVRVALAEPVLVFRGTRDDLGVLNRPR